MLTVLIVFQEKIIGVLGSEQGFECKDLGILNRKFLESASGPGLLQGIKLSPHPICGFGAIVGKSYRYFDMILEFLNRHADGYRQRTGDGNRLTQQ